VTVGGVFLGNVPRLLSCMGLVKKPPVTLIGQSKGLGNY
jgi:hypothetical protein